METIQAAAPSPASRATPEAAVGEALAEHLSQEHDYADNMTPGHQWPLHPKDDGYRGGGYVRLVPADVQAHRRDDAQRILAFLAPYTHAETATLRARLAACEAREAGLREIVRSYNSDDEIFDAEKGGLRRVTEKDAKAVLDALAGQAEPKGGDIHG